MVFKLDREKSFGFSYVGMNCGFEVKGASLEWGVLNIHAKEAHRMKLEKVLRINIIEV